MSRPQKIIPPVRGGFQEIINNVTDGRGVKGQPSPRDTRNMANEKMVRSQPKPPEKK